MLRLRNKTENFNGDKGSRKFLILTAIVSAAAVIFLAAHLISFLNGELKHNIRTELSSNEKAAVENEIGISVPPEAHIESVKLSTDGSSSLLVLINGIENSDSFVDECTDFGLSDGKKVSINTSMYSNNKTDAVLYTDSEKGIQCYVYSSESGFNAYIIDSKIENSETYNIFEQGG